MKAVLSDRSCSSTVAPGPVLYRLLTLVLIGASTGQMPKLRAMDLMRNPTVFLVRQ
jgi:hypothetical protein